MIETIFILIAYVIGTSFGWHYGKQTGLKQGINVTVDNLIEQGYLKFKGIKSNPEILKHDEE